MWNRKNKIELDEYEKFEMITNEQKKNPDEILLNFIKKYNDKYDEDYKKALDNFWSK